MSTLEKFHYQITGRTMIAGDEPPLRLVFLHGVMGFALNFRSVARAFEADYQVLTYDQRGHGRSFHPESGYQPEDYATDLRDILDELGWKKIHLVGHSMGGRVAMHFTSRFPERVTRLVIEDIGPVKQEHGTNLVLRMLDAVPVPFSDKRVARQWFDSTFLQLFKDEYKKEGLAAYLYANLTENDAKEAVWRFSQAGIRESVVASHDWQGWQEIRILTAPTLLIRGEFSHDLPRQLFLEVLRTNPHFAGVEIKGAGHWVHSDQPALFIGCVTRFLKGLKQESGAGVESIEPL